MPSRILREGIIGSARVNALTLGAEVFYRRLMSVADDHGRFYASVITLRGALWPRHPELVSESQIERWLKECTAGDEPLVTLYEVAGGKFLQISNFRQQTRAKSKFPDCLSNAKQMLSVCEANAQPIRIRISDSESYSAMPNENLKPKMDQARDLLKDFPGAQRLPGIPDDVIVGKCLLNAGDSIDRLGQALRIMQLAKKKPEISWAWFPPLVKQYVLRLNDEAIA